MWHSRSQQNQVHILVGKINCGVIF